eukprot:355943-Chlamydomonas_euryale.AAC.3
MSDAAALRQRARAAGDRGVGGVGGGARDGGADASTSEEGAQGGMGMGGGGGRAGGLPSCAGPLSQGERGIARNHAANMRSAPARLLLAVALLLCGAFGILGPSLLSRLCSCPPADQDGVPGEAGHGPRTAFQAAPPAWPLLPPHCAPAEATLAEWAAYTASAGSAGSSAPPAMCVVGPSGACVSLLRPASLLAPCPRSADAAHCWGLGDGRGAGGGGSPTLDVLVAVGGNGRQLAGALAVLLAELPAGAEVELMLQGARHGDAALPTTAMDCVEPAAAMLAALGLGGRVCFAGSGECGGGGGGGGSGGRPPRTLLLSDAVLLGRGSLRALLGTASRLRASVLAPQVSPPRALHTARDNNGHWSWGQHTWITHCARRRKQAGAESKGRGGSGGGGRCW